MRLAIFGGSFDPPHVGHLLASTDAHEQLGLDRLIVVPTGTQPLKIGAAAATATAEQRLEMARLTFSEDARFEISDVEVRRGGLSFTVDTLTEVAERYGEAERFLLLGLDVLGTFTKWKDPERILRLARPVLLERQHDREVALPAVFQETNAIRLSTRRIDVSSTEIRQRVQSGKSIRGFVTEKVAAYIERGGLYR
ncbi:MAG TPA: nicotinate (nicotinamide) nucleotide adenylyltransferase [Gemmatimonadaceae bacterium]|nr:nicotinate (nicotinamide) nucleotide adenylyltransferase [Gemmatimonadaceae bacterium]